MNTRDRLLVAAAVGVLAYLIAPGAVAGIGTTLRAVRPAWRRANPAQKSLLTLGVVGTLVPGIITAPTLWYAAHLGA